MQKQKYRGDCNGERNIRFSQHDSLISMSGGLVEGKSSFCVGKKKALMQRDTPTHMWLS